MTTTLGIQWLCEQRATGHPDHDADYATELAQECDKLRASFTLAEDNARQSREEIEALKGDVAAMAANQGEWMRRAMAFEDQLAAAQARPGFQERTEAYKKLADELAAAQAEAARLREALRFIQWNGGGHTDEGVSCNGTWCAEQARAALAKEGQR